MVKTPAIEAFWQQLGLDEPYEVWSFGDSPALADSLLALVLGGQKTATCGLLWDMGTPDSPPPVLGGYSVILDGTRAPRAVLQTIALTTMPFAAVPEDFALAEGEGGTGRCLDHHVRPRRPCLGRLLRARALS